MMMTVCRAMPRSSKRDARRAGSAASGPVWFGAWRGVLCVVKWVSHVSLVGDSLVGDSLVGDSLSNWRKSRACPYGPQPLAPFPWNPPTDDSRTRSAEGSCARVDADGHHGLGEERLLLAGADLIGRTRPIDAGAERVLVIRLGSWRKTHDEIEPGAHRSGIGYRDGMPLTELVDATRAWWRINPARVQWEGISYAVAVRQGITRAVMEIGDWTQRSDGRWAFSADPLTDGPVHEKWGWDSGTPDPLSERQSKSGFSTGRRGSAPSVPDLERSRIGAARLDPSAGMTSRRCHRYGARRSGLRDWTPQRVGAVRTRLA